MALALRGLKTQGLTHQHGVLGVAGLPAGRQVLFLSPRPKFMTFKLITQNYLPVSSSHKIYYATYGNPNGVPILFIHGGPGSKSKITHLDYLPDSDNIYAILFDQRGCGQSQPVGETKNNTTKDLINDIEKLKNHLNISKWYVTGGSWGSTLALLYAQTYPDSVKGLILRNIFLARPQDIDWIYNPNGVGRFYPDKFQKIKKYLQHQNLKWADLLTHAYQIITQQNITRKKQIISLIFNWEYTLMNIDVPVHDLTPDEVDDDFIHSATIYLHYTVNKFFISQNQILNQINTIKHIPTIIVHGRYDMICPPQQAYILHQHLPNSKLFFTNFAGHHLTWDGQIWIKHLTKDMIFS